MSPQHYTKSTVSVSVWCNTCGKETMHRVDAGRRGPCLACMEKKRSKPEHATAAAPAKAEQGRLFR
jgi:hypothetical protein